MMNSKALLDYNSSKIVANFTAACDIEISVTNNTICVLERSEIFCYNVSNFEQKWKLPHPEFFPINESKCILLTASSSET